MEEGSSCDVVDVVFKREVIVQNDAEVADVSGWGQGGVVDSEVEIVDSFGEGFGADDEHF